jgi:hypothetical protein
VDPLDEDANGELESNDGSKLIVTQKIMSPDERKK